MTHPTHPKSKFLSIQFELALGSHASYVRRVSIDTLKSELAGLSSRQRRQVMAFLVSLEDSRDNAYRRKLAKKIDDENPAHWVEDKDLDAKLGLTCDKR